jgi:hypothetical protein
MKSIQKFIICVMILTMDEIDVGFKHHYDQIGSYATECGAHIVASNMSYAVIMLSFVGVG